MYKAPLSELRKEPDEIVSKMERKNCKPCKMGYIKRFPLSTHILRMYIILHKNKASLKLVNSPSEDLSGEYRHHQGVAV